MNNITQCFEKPKISKIKKKEEKYSESQVFTNKQIDELRKGVTWSGGTIAEEIFFD